MVKGDHSHAFLSHPNKASLPGFPVLPVEMLGHREAFTFEALEA